MQVVKMFDELARIYDLGNHLLSLGLDFSWRRRLALELTRYQPLAILDLACGTGDLALMIKRYHPGSVIVSVDLSQNMLKLCAEKILKNQSQDFILPAQADLEQLPFPDQSFDALSIAFGVRNLENLAQGLAESFRVLKPRGIFAVLEFSLPRSGFFSRIYRFYLGKILPRLGQALGGKSAYFYLRDTIQEFLSPELFSRELAQTGFLVKKIIPLTRGAVYLYLAEKPKDQGSLS